MPNTISFAGFCPYVALIVATRQQYIFEEFFLVPLDILTNKELFQENVCPAMM